MKKRYTVGIVFYVLAVIYFLATFIEAWYWSFVFALAPALVGYIVGAIFDSQNKNNTPPVSGNPSIRHSYRWALSFTVLILSVIAMLGGFFGNAHDTFFTVGVLVYVILPTIAAFVIGYLIDKFSNHS